MQSSLGSYKQTFTDFIFTLEGWTQKARKEYTPAKTTFQEHDKYGTRTCLHVSFFLGHKQFCHALYCQSCLCHQMEYTASRSCLVSCLLVYNVLPWTAADALCFDTVFCRLPASLVFVNVIVWCTASHCCCLFTYFSRFLRGNQLTQLPEGLLSATTQLQVL